MPITEREWTNGTLDEVRDEPYTTPVGEYETEKDLIIAFLGENVNNAYTRTEIIMGVDFGETTSQESIRGRLANLSNVILDAVGHVTASAIVIDDVDEALDELVAEGIVERKEVEDGEEATAYYRIHK